MPMPAPQRWIAALRQGWRDSAASGTRMRYFALIYLGFLFLPLTEPATWHDRRWIEATLLSLPPFLLLYLGGRHGGQRQGLLAAVGIALIGYALMPFNPFGNTYLIFACSVVSFTLPGLGRALAFAVALNLMLALQVWYLDYPPMITALTALICLAWCVGNHYYLDNRRKDVALALSHDEVRRLAATAERERIGRDLHDLLGHTLSLIAVKLELAERLIERDTARAQVELRQSQQITREALTQVRSAVTGIRASGLAAELASSRLLLESSQVRFSCERDPLALSAALESALAMILREAVTNIHRHAGARRAQVRLLRDGDALRLSVSDDGRGGVQADGNGLRGMRERVAALGGSLAIDSPRGGGTEVRICVPLPAGHGPAADIASAA